MQKVYRGSVLNLPEYHCFIEIELSEIEPEMSL